MLDHSTLSCRGFFLVRQRPIATYFYPSGGIFRRPAPIYCFL